MPTDLALPSKACHNCRRRRWKCDRSLPVCQKCLSSGSECLGYGKLFVWNQGVASRGKMMGKTYEERLATKKVTQEHPTHRDAQLQSNDSGVIDPPNFAEEMPTLDNCDASLLTDIVTQDTANPIIQWALADPLVQDLNPHNRYYLYHFATQICADMVINDGPDQINPFRDLIPATSAYPLLLQIILANSAFHVFNISREPMDASIYQQNQKPCLTAYYRAVSRFGGPLKTSYRDALVAKSNALSLLAQSVATVNESNIDVILATILFFVNYALIESGQDKWKVHLEGARRLIHLCGTPSYQPQAMSQLRTCLLSDFLVFSILGSLFCYTTSPKLIPETIELEPILRWAETNNYLSCPAPLLRIMLQSFELPDAREVESAGLSDQIGEKVKELLEAALHFDPVEWTYNYLPVTHFEDPEKRVRISSAHRSAVCIYLVRVLPCSNPLLDPSSGTALVSLTGLADDIIHHISHIQPTDHVFKSISWPLFLAGAESETLEQRTWIMNTFDTFYSVMYWGYVPTVKKVLQEIWSRRDQAAEGADNCWMDEVQDIGTEILIA